MKKSKKVKRLLPLILAAVLVLNPLCGDLQNVYADTNEGVSANANIESPELIDDSTFDGAKDGTNVDSGNDSDFDINASDEGVDSDNENTSSGNDDSDNTSNYDANDDFTFDDPQEETDIASNDDSDPDINASDEEVDSENENTSSEDDEDDETAEDDIIEEGFTVDEIIDEVPINEIGTGTLYNSVKTENSTIIVSLCEFDDNIFEYTEKPELSDLLKEFPAYLSAVAISEDENGNTSTVKLSVSWECENDYESSEELYYVFNAVPEWDEDRYLLADGEELPQIFVSIMSIATLSATEDNELEMKFIVEPEYIYGNFEIQVTGTYEEATLYLYVRKSSGSTTRITSFDHEGGEVNFTYSSAENASSSPISTEGNYIFYITEVGYTSGYNSRVASIEASIKSFTDVTIALNENAENCSYLYKTYGRNDSASTFTLDGQYFDVAGDLAGKVTLPKLSKVFITREEGELPGKYKILSITADGFDSVTLEENGFNYYTIKKISVTSSGYTKTFETFTDGFTKTIPIDSFYSLSGERAPVSGKLEELSDEVLQYFSTPPTVDGLNLTFAFKESDETINFKLNIALENDLYSYGSGLTLSITAGPRTYVEARTEEEIKDYLNEYPFSLSSSDTWDVKPDISTETAGVLSASTRQNALNSLNFIRYIAGIPSVDYSEEKEVYMQTGTTLLTKVGTLTHYPSQPSGVSDEFYQIGYTGTTSSNLGMGYTTLAAAVVNGWMNDGDSSNIAAVGHRRWCLDPNMQETAFGHSGSYTAMYSFDSYDRDRSYEWDYIPWPAQTMPVNYFTGPWSVSLSRDNYSTKTDDYSDVKVTLEKNGGTTYTLDSSNTNKSGKYFNVSSSGYGYGVTLIFNPNVSFSAGDEVKVTITGVKDQYGNETPISYTVNFFTTASSSSSSSSGSSSSSKSSSGGGGGSSGGGSSSRSSSSSSSTVSAETDSSSGNTLPDYVVNGNWSNPEGRIWHFTDDSNVLYAERWAAVYNPYADISKGQQAFDWFRFDANGNMLFGWYLDSNADWYYLNPVSDGTLGAMLTGWQWIPDANGVSYCYYFNPVSDGYRGRMMHDTVVDGYTLDSEGHWTVDGVPQTK